MMYEIQVSVDYDELLIQLKEGEQVLASGYYASLSDGIFDMQKNLLEFLGKEWE